MQTGVFAQTLEERVTRVPEALHRDAGRVRGFFQRDILLLGEARGARAARRAAFTCFERAGALGA
jgi:hypothetical protein